MSHSSLHLSSVHGDHPFHCPSWSLHTYALCHNHPHIHTLSLAYTHSHILAHFLSHACFHTHALLVFTHSFAHALAVSHIHTLIHAYTPIHILHLFSLPPPLVLLHHHHHSVSPGLGRHAHGLHAELLQLHRAHTLRLPLCDNGGHAGRLAAA